MAHRKGHKTYSSWEQSPGGKARKVLGSIGKGIKKAAQYGKSYGTTAGVAKKAASWAQKQGFVPSIR
jgi:hypothetical protein